MLDCVQWIWIHCTKDYRETYIDLAHHKSLQQLLQGFSDIALQLNTEWNVHLNCQVCPCHYRYITGLRMILTLVTPMQKEWSMYKTSKASYLLIRPSMIVIFTTNILQSICVHFIVYRPYKTTSFASVNFASTFAGHKKTSLFCWNVI